MQVVTNIPIGMFGGLAVTRNGARAKEDLVADDAIGARGPVGHLRGPEGVDGR